MFSKKNIQDIKIEGTAHASGSRRMLVGKDETTSKYFKACTYGFLPAGVKWEMHEHDNIVEICIVAKGKGVVRDSEGNEENFVEGDRLIFPSNAKHEIENNSDAEAEFYFVRFQDQ